MEESTQEDRLREWQERSAAGHIAASSSEEREAQDRAREHAEWMEHPHTQLSQIVADLQAPHIDLHDRIAAVHRNTLALAQFLRREVEAPLKPGEKKEEVA
jgi:hypothetical protein